ncbi:MAG: hypothetical protein ACK5IQ_00080 [Bacteroidales bacterium]
MVEASKYNVLPLDDSKIERFDVANRPSYAEGKTSFTYYSDMIRIPEGSAPDMKNSKLVYHYNFLRTDRYEVLSDKALPSGKTSITCKFDYEGDKPGAGGTMTLLADGKQIGKGKIAKTIPVRVSYETLDIGRETGTPVSEAYKVPANFTGEVEKVHIELN